METASDSKHRFVWEVIIVGAGLSGLSAAYYLKKAGVDALVLEARERCGGRILTVAAEGNATPVEMGATWFADKHVHLMHLLKELKLPFFKQYQQGIGVFETSDLEPPQLFEIPNSEEPSYRLAGGTSRLVETLIASVGEEQVILNCPIAKVIEQQDYLMLENRSGEVFCCRNLIMTIPPFLALSQGIEFVPGLPEGLRGIMQNTHTWMGESLKFAVAYARPFWRERGYAGTVFSQAGIVQEAYDHTNEEETGFSLKGFLAVAVSELTKEEREVMVIAQLKKLLGREAGSYLSYTEKVWKKEVFTYAAYWKYILPHQHNGHPLYTQQLMHGRLKLSGTETSPIFGGYMDGAVYSGLTAATNIIRK